MKQTFKLSWVLIALLAVTVISSCKKDDDDDDVQEVIAGFTYQVDAEDPFTVQFTSTAKNQTSLKWEFGDGQESTETNPSHTYAAEGTYSVKLTATNAGGSDDVTIEVEITDPNEQLNILTGGSQKSWKLIRKTDTGRYPLEVGKNEVPRTIWWAFGRDAQLSERPCIFNDEWIFTSEGEMIFDAHGDYWAEASVGETLIFHPDLANSCQPTTSMYGPNNEDLTVWGNGTHEFEIAGGKLTVTGLGAYIGLVKAGTGAEVAVPQESVSYDLVKLVDAEVADTLIVETTYTTGDDQPGYWRFVLVAYDDPSDEPDIPTGVAPGGDFEFTATGMTVNFVNTSTENPTSYEWNFGDGSAVSTEANPTHTYSTPGFYSVSMTATNASGVGSAAAIVLVTGDELTDGALQGTWKLRLAENSVFVGPGLGLSNWWSVPLSDMQEGGAWACMWNDEFIFSTGGVYEYSTNGEARNDGWMNATGGCYSDAELALMNFPFLSATHSYALTSETNPVITLTQGDTPNAPFIGFYKGYYGGENMGEATVPNGGLNTNRYEVVGYGNVDGTEYLYISVDLNGDTEAGNGWSAILEKVNPR